MKLEKKNTDMTTDDDSDSADLIYIEINLHVLLHVEESNGISIASEGILVDVCDVVGAQVQVTQAMQRAQSFRRNLVQTIVSQAKVLQVFYKISFMNITPIKKQ